MNLEKLTLLMNSVEEIIREILYSGMKLTGKHLIKKIDVIFHQASKLNHYRLATSFRYIKIEFNKNIDENSTFSIDRLMFFISQAWLLCEKTRKSIIMNDLKELKQNMENPEEEVDFKELSLRLIGIRQHNIEGSIMGFTFYFLAIDSSLKGKIVLYDYLIRSTPNSSLDYLLLHSFSSISFYLSEMFFTDFKFKDIQVNKINMKIKLTDKSKFQLKKEQPITIDTYLETLWIKLEIEFKKLIHKVQAKGIENLTEEEKYKYKKNEKLFQRNIPVYIEEVPHIDLLLQNYGVESLAEIIDQISKYHISPIDLPESFQNFILLQDVKFQEEITEKENPEHKSTYMMRIISKQNYPMIISLNRKPINEILIQSLKQYMKDKDTIEHLFCFYYLNHNQIMIYPLSILNNKELIFPALSRDFNWKLKRNILEVPKSKKK